MSARWVTDRGRHAGGSVHPGDTRCLGKRRTDKATSGRGESGFATCRPHTHPGYGSTEFGASGLGVRGGGHMADGSMFVRAVIFVNTA